MPEEAIDGVSEDGRKFTRCLLHLTPLKDGNVSRGARLPPGDLFSSIQ